MRVKGSKIVDLFANADKPKRNAEAFSEGKGDTALRAAIEFGECQTGEGRRFMEAIGLRQRVLACGRIEHQQDFVGQARVLLL